jgi:hypothetical protein
MEINNLRGFPSWPERKISYHEIRPPGERRLGTPSLFAFPRSFSLFGLRVPARRISKSKAPKRINKDYHTTVVWECKCFF